MHYFNGCVIYMVDSTGEYQYARGTKPNRLPSGKWSNGEINWTDNIENASVYNPDKEKEQITIIINQLKEKHSAGNEIHLGEKWTTVSKVDYDSGEWLNFRKAKALKKLNLDDIEALDLKTEAMHHKLKDDS